MCPSRPQEKHTMQLPLTDRDTLFEELLQDLPSEMAHMAREFKAFVRAKKVQTPEQLLRVVFLYCGLDKSLREVAGTFTALDQGRKYHGPRGRGALARAWSMGASDATADAARGRERDTAGGAPLGGH